MGAAQTLVFTKSENASAFIRALATGWRYRKAYETDRSVWDISKSERFGDRTIYKYLNLAYMSPKIVNAIMDSEVPAHVSLQMLFGLSSKYENFPEQERTFVQA